VVKGARKFAHVLLLKNGQIGWEEAAVEKKAENAETLGPCPVCAGDVVVGKKAYGCSNWRNGCKFVVWKTIAQKEITPEVVQVLLTERITNLMTGFTSKAGKSFDAKLKVVAGEVKFDFSS